jgi:deoxyhypusine synthase
MKNVSKFSRFSRLNPQPAARGARASQLVADTFHAYNASRLREGCELITRKMLPRDGLVGFSLTGALVPAGLGKSCLIPLIKAGFIDWIVTTGANLYHDIHYGLGMKLYRASPFLEDVELRKRRIIRIYDIVFDYSVLLDTDARSSGVPNFSAAWAPTSFTICSENTSTSVSANSGSNTLRSSRSPTSTVCPASAAARATVPLA